MIRLLRGPGFHRKAQKGSKWNRVAKLLHLQRSKAPVRACLRSAVLLFRLSRCGAQVPATGSAAQRSPFAIMHEDFKRAQSQMRVALALPWLCRKHLWLMFVASVLSSARQGETN